ncbi:hypothetical protein P9J64_15170 [Deltaproteobacteria bacterium IMCC39524]|nr:hypothetical protein [Deltaproteobacteria bacterium IMCC39524]
MKRLKSLQDVLDHKDTIPTLAYIRGIQFCGSQGYQADIDGWIVVMQEGDDITHIKEIGVDGLFDDELPNFEYCSAFADGAQVTFELVFQLDDSRTVAVIVPDEPWLDPFLRNILREAAGALLPLSQIKEVTL